MDTLKAVRELALLVSELADIVSDVSAHGGDGRLASNDRETARISQEAMTIRGLVGREEGDDHEEI